MYVDINQGGKRGEEETTCSILVQSFLFASANERFRDACQGDLFVDVYSVDPTTMAIRSTNSPRTRTV